MAKEQPTKKITKKEREKIVQKRQLLIVGNIEKRKQKREK